MATWQYAWLTDQPYTTIGFSHPQQGLAAELASVLGAGVLMSNSSEWSVTLDRSRVNLGYVSGLLGDRGWEMFSVETRLQPGAMTPNQLQTNWYFKKPGPDRSSATVASSAGAGAMSSTTPDAQTATPAASQWGTPSASAGASPTMASSPSMGSSPAAPAAPSVASSPTSSGMSSSGMSSSPGTSSAPEMAPQTAPQMPSAPQAPAAPPGPEQAPMNTTTPPPPGPDGTR